MNFTRHPLALHRYTHLSERLFRLTAGRVRLTLSRTCVATPNGAPHHRQSAYVMFGRVSTRSASSTWSRQRRWRAIVCPQWKKFSTARWRLTLRHCGCVVAMCARCTAPLVRDGMNRRMQKSHEATLALERHKVEASHRVRVGDLNKFFDGQLVRVLNILAFPGRAMAISPPFRRWMQQTPFSAHLMRRWQRCRNRPTQLKPR